MFTVKEIAQRLRVSATCVYQLIERGKIACHRIGTGRGTIRISEEDLTAFLTSCREVSEELPKQLERTKQTLRHLRF